MNFAIEQLLRPDAFAHPVGTIELLETHISWVILTGEYAYKIKKPVDLGFVDFTTLERRHLFCQEELRLNRRLAKEIYLAVCPIYREKMGLSLRPATHAEGGPPIEYAVQMKQFSQNQMLPVVLARGELSSEHWDRLAKDIARFHAEAPVAGRDSEFGGPESVQGAAIANFEHLTGAAHLKDEIEELRNWTDAESALRSPWFLERRAAGWVRECHGDMHLGNMVLIDDQIRVFDCIEFNAQLRWIDVISEVAFVVMDLCDRGYGGIAFAFLNRWLEELGDYGGLTGLRWYLVYRALVRAKVAQLRIEQPQITPEEQREKEREQVAYLDLAAGWARTPAPAVIIMQGVSGSGKSWVSQQIVEELGAIRLRADVERKRMFCSAGSGEETMYSPRVTETVYRELLAGRVAGILQAGFSVVIDATNLLTWQRKLFYEVATEQGVPWIIVDVHASDITLRNRLISRSVKGNDPSDADVSVMEHQCAQREPLTDFERSRALRIDTDQPFDRAAVIDLLKSRLSTSADHEKDRAC